MVELSSDGEMEHGKSLTLTCTATDARPDTGLTFHWREDGNTIVTQTSDTLVIAPLDYSKDDGNYTCAAENTPGRGAWSNVIPVYVTCKGNCCIYDKPLYILYCMLIAILI